MDKLNNKKNQVRKRRQFKKQRLKSKKFKRALWLWIKFRLLKMKRRKKSLYNKNVKR